MGNLTTGVLEYIRRLPAGCVIAPKELLHLGSRAAVDQALSRLVKRGHVSRLFRGVYAVPTAGRFGQKLPSATAVAKEFADRRGEPLVRHGAAVANSLGLTTQVPMREIFLTHGRSRKILIGKQTIEFRHAPSWQLREGRTGDVLRALAWLGQQGSRAELPRLRTILGPTEAKGLLDERKSLPTWVAREVGELVNAG